MAELLVTTATHVDDKLLNDDNLHNEKNKQKQKIKQTGDINDSPKSVCLDAAKILLLTLFQTSTIILLPGNEK